MKKKYIFIGIIVIIILAIFSYEETITPILEDGTPDYSARETRDFRSLFSDDESYDRDSKKSKKSERGDDDRDDDRDVHDKKLVLTFIEELYNNKNYSVLDELVDENIKQHDPLVGDGVVSIKNSLEETWFSAFPEYYVDIKRAVADDGLVFVQRHVTINTEDRRNDYAENSFALGEIYLLEGKKDERRIVEHWSITQPVSPTSVNGNSMFDGERFEKESKRVEEKNKKIVLRYMLEALNGRDVDVLDEILDENWIAHNPTEQNGRENLKDLFQNVFFAQFPNLYADVKRVGAEGNLVFVHTHYTVNKQDVGNGFTGAANMDIFRLEDGIIVEHWDIVMRPVPETTVSGRSMFDGGALYNYKNERYGKDKDKKDKDGDKKKDKRKKKSDERY